MLKAAKFEDDFNLLPHKDILALDAAVQAQFNNQPYGPFMAVKMLAGERTALLLSDQDHQQLVRPESYRSHPVLSGPSLSMSPRKRRHQDIDLDDLSD